MQVTFSFAGEITQVSDAIPWVRCASGNVYSFDLDLYLCFFFLLYLSLFYSNYVEVVRKNLRGQTLILTVPALLPACILFICIVFVFVFVLFQLDVVKNSRGANVNFHVSVLLPLCSLSTSCLKQSRTGRSWTALGKCIIFCSWKIKVTLNQMFNIMFMKTNITLHVTSYIFLLCQVPVCKGYFL